MNKKGDRNGKGMKKIFKWILMELNGKDQVKNNKINNKIK